MNRLLTFLASTTTLFLIGCSSDEDPGIVNGKFPNGPQFKAEDFKSEKIICDFPDKFMNAASKYWQMEGIDDNTMLSPLGASITLAMLANAASTECKAEILDAFGMDDVELDMLNNTMGKICHDLPHNVSGSVISMANGLWLYNSLNITSDYSKNLTDVFNTTIETFDDPSNGITKINTWVNKNTNGLINKLFDDNNKDLIMLIANVLYMNASWKDDFKETTIGNFTNLDKSISYTEMMSGTQEITDYYETSDGDKMFNLSYADNHISISIFIPNEENLTDINNFDKLNSMYYISQNLEYGSGKTKLTMPKFSLNVDNDLVPIFREMGVNSLFQSESLTSITNASGRGTSIDFFQQKIRLDVDEKGCAVAAVTYAWSESAPMPHPPVPSEITIDRPFLFKIHAYGLPLLEGRVVKL